MAPAGPFETFPEPLLEDPCPPADLIGVFEGVTPLYTEEDVIVRRLEEAEMAYLYSRGVFDYCSDAHHW